MSQSSVIIVGAGPGGLASALLLAHAGLHVRVIEKAEQVGGRTSALVAEEFRFDRGPTFFQYPQILQEIFATVGRDLFREVPMIRLDPQYRLVFGSGGHLDATNDSQRMQAEIARLSPHDAAAFPRFLEDTRRKFEAVRPILELEWGGWRDLIRPELGKALPFLRPWQSLDGELHRYFQDERLRVAFSFQSKYLGMSPFRCPSLFSILSFLEYEYGIFHPVGGCHAVMERMAEIAAEMGVEFHLEEPVEEILFRGRRVTGVRTARRSYDCDRLVVNADFAQAMRTLVPSLHRRRWTDHKIERSRFSCSTYMMYLGLEGQCPDLPHHTISICSDYRENLAEIEDRHVLSDDPSFYVQHATATDQTLAPPGCSTLYVLIPVSHQHPNIDWRIERSRYREVALKCLSRLGIDDVSRRIRFEEIVTPHDWEHRFGIHRGATFNLSHTLGQMLHLRPRNRFEECDGVYLVGGGTHPGSGLPVIFQSRALVRGCCSTIWTGRPLLLCLLRWRNGTLHFRQSPWGEPEMASLLSGLPVVAEESPVIGTVVQRARHAQTEWVETSIRQRLDWVRRARQRLVEHVTELRDAATIPPRTDPAETLAAEILPLADACRFLEREAASALAPQQRRRHRPFWMRGVEVEVAREPWGVVLVIGAGNYPLFLPGVQTVQALVAGNAVLLKPGRNGAAAARAWAAVLYEAGLPPDLLTVLSEDPQAAEETMAAGVDFVSLTGSADTGRQVLRQLADTLTPATMELSGCDAVFVLNDADLDRAAEAVAFGLRFNGSATCIAPRRVFVDAAVSEDFERRLRAAVQRHPLSGVAVTDWERVNALIRDAVSNGARQVSGRVERGRVMEPFVLADTHPAMPLLQADLFAPVVSLVTTHDMRQALQFHRQCPYALGASLFGSPEQTQRLARQIDAGCVVVNDMIVPTADPRVPFGGRRESGFGTTRGREGLLALTRPKVIVTQRNRWLPHLEPAMLDAEFFTRYLEAAHGPTLRSRCSAAWKLMQQARRVWARRKRAAGQSADHAAPRQETVRG